MTTTSSTPISDFSPHGPWWFLSNFARSPITIDGITYRTVEHAYQAHKTLDITERRRIAAIPTPGAAKRAGQRVALRGNWERVKLSVMLECLRLKFADPELEDALLSSGDRELIEGNTWHDNTWGNCICPRCRATSGQNLLGKLLMQVRSELGGGEH